MESKTSGMRFCSHFSFEGVVKLQKKYVNVYKYLYITIFIYR